MAIFNVGITSQERDPEKEFWRQVDIRGDQECWPWKGPTNDRGYPRFQFNYKRCAASRVAYQLINDVDLSSSQKLIRTCLNPECVNPSHQKIGTQKEVIRFASSRGKMACGVSSGTSKLKPTDVAVIRHRYWIGCESGRRIARDYCVGHKAILKAARGETWAHIPMPDTTLRNKKDRLRARRRFKIMRRDGYRCQICGRNSRDGISLHIDHKTPRSRGGSDEEDNLWVLCDECNLGKGDLMLDPKPKS